MHTTGTGSTGHHGTELLVGLARRPHPAHPPAWACALLRAGVDGWVGRIVADFADLGVVYVLDTGHPVAVEMVFRAPLPPVGGTVRAPGLGRFARSATGLSFRPCISADWAPPGCGPDDGDGALLLRAVCGTPVGTGVGWGMFGGRDVRVPLPSAATEDGACELRVELDLRRGAGAHGRCWRLPPVAPAGGGLPPVGLLGRLVVDPRSVLGRWVPTTPLTRDEPLPCLFPAKRPRC